MRTCRREFWQLHSAVGHLTFLSPANSRFGFYGGVCRMMPWVLLRDVLYDKVGEVLRAKADGVGVVRRII